MASWIKSMESNIQAMQAWALTKRLLLVLLVFCVQLVYVPTSNRLSGGIEPKLAIDVFPVWAVWVLPYVLCYPLWLAGLGWAIFRMEARLFRSFIAAFLTTCSIAAVIFIFFPTYVPAATITGNDLFSSLLRFIHENWGRYDAFPSGHVYITVLLALFYERWYPHYKMYWVLITIIVCLSTLFTLQHYIIDIIGGLVVAWIGFHIGLRWAGFSLLPQRPGKTRLLQPPT